MEVLTKGDRRLKLVAGILGVIQSLAIVVLAGVCIYCHNTEHLKLDDIIHRTGADFYFYLFFIHGGVSYSGHILDSPAFYVVSIVYVVLNAVWFVVSLYVSFAKGSQVKTSLKAWSFITLLVCGCDLALTVVLGVDYDACLHHLENSPYFLFLYLNGDGSAVCDETFLPVLFVAAKGFVLWIINFILGVILMKMAAKLLIALRDTPQFSSAYTNPQINPSAPQFGAPHSPNPRNYSPYYSDPSDYYEWHHENQYVQPYSASPKRQWNVYSPNPATGPIWGGNSPDFLRQNVVSNQTQKPFVLASPPRRYGGF